MPGATEEYVPTRSASCDPHACGSLPFGRASARSIDSPAGGRRDARLLELDVAPPVHRPPYRPPRAAAPELLVLHRHVACPCATLSASWAQANSVNRPS